jgi:hypothetical protein
MNSLKNLMVPRRPQGDRGQQAGLRAARRLLRGDDDLRATMLIARHVLWSEMR